ncbi:MAG: uracil-DNA glycosylase [Sphingomonas sp.]|nr:uracil-DNA glycosylase [Sphingomonas sp.]
MGAAQNFDWHRAMASALDWWHDAGVDALVDEVPRDWLAPLPSAEPASQTQPTTSRQAAPAPAARSFDFPDTLPAFEAWRLSDAAPDSGWPGQRIGAQGAAADGSAPELMIAIEMPERADDESGLLLSGPAGRLFDRMLAAIGRDRQSVYLVPMCVARPSSGRLPAEDEPALAAALRHQLALAAPQRLLVIGNAASRALLGLEIQTARGRIHHVNHPGGMVAGVASFHPRLLLERPAAKPEAWKDLQLLIRGTRS